jgi:hypothetical protein
MIRTNAWLRLSACKQGPVPLRDFQRRHTVAILLILQVLVEKAAHSDNVRLSLSSGLDLAEHGASARSSCECRMIGQRSGSALTAGNMRPA